LTFRFSATVKSTVATGSSFTNTVNVPGDTQEGAITQQRAKTGSANASIGTQTAQTLKQVTATSENFTNPG